VKTLTKAAEAGKMPFSLEKRHLAARNQAKRPANKTSIALGMVLLKKLLSGRFINFVTRSFSNKCLLLLPKC
jgi:hypothetical protein